MELAFDTDQGRGMARKMLDTHAAINHLTNNAISLSEALIAAGWNAPSAGEFDTALHAWANAIRPILDRLADARRRLMAEIAEWEQTGQTFEGDPGTAGATTGPTVGPDGVRRDANGRPVDASGMIILDRNSNMSDLAAAIIQLNDNKTPVRIVQIGPNEYVVLIAGTDNYAGANNWTNAVSSGNGLPTNFSDEVKRLINLAGHSQGGLVALTLADDQSLVDRYHINSVTTFAASGNADYNPRVGQDKYHNYLTENDPMRGLEYDPYPSSQLHRILPTPGAFGDPTVHPTVIPAAGGAPLYGGHSTYPDSPVLKNTPLPFNISQPWPTNGSGAHSTPQFDNLTQAVVDASHGAPSSLIDVPVEGTKFAFNNFVVAPADHAIRSVIGYAPEPIRTAYDRGADWFENGLATGPSASQAAQHAASGVGEIVAAPFQGSWTALTDTASASRDLVQGDLGGAVSHLGDAAVHGATDAASGLGQGTLDAGQGVVDFLF